MNPFDIVASVSHTKQRVIDAENEKDYSAFMVNRALSYYPDTVFYAQEMNVNHHADGLLQYDYYLHSLRKKKRFSKWFKKSKSEDVDAIMRKYQCSYRKATEIMSVLTKDQLSEIKDIMNKGID